MAIYFAGSKNYNALGSKSAGDEILSIPHLIPLSGVERVFGGSQGAHFFATCKNGKEVYGWGRNVEGQLGLGHTKNVPKPTLLSFPINENVVEIACGKRHTLFLFANGKVLAAGKNDFGQLGTGRTSEYEAKPVAVKEDCLSAGGRSVSCGIDFSLVLCEDDCLYSFGYPANGRLGLGNDGSYNSSASSIKMAYEKNSKPALVPGKYLLACAGASHCVVADTEGTILTFGEGSYGRLGNGKLSNDDQTSPTPVEASDFGRQKSPPAKIWAGKTYSCAALKNGTFILWGRLRQTSEVQNRPKPDYAYSGQGTIVQVAFSGDGFVFLAGGAACAMGTGTHKQLALGEAKGSTSKPDYCSSFEDVVISQVAAGAEAMVYLVDPKSIDAAALKKLPTISFDAAGNDSNDSDSEEAAAASSKSKSKVKKAKPAAKSKAATKRKGKSAESDGDKTDDEEVAPKKKAAAKGKKAAKKE